MERPEHRLGRVLLDEEKIRECVRTLASRIDDDYATRPTDPVIVAVLKGSLHFVSDLTRSMRTDMEIQFVQASTYPEGTTAQKETRLQVWSGLSVEERDVLVVDDILDRGFTIRAVRDLITVRKPARLRWAFLLVKEGAPNRSGIRPDYAGATIPDRWVVGYGLDWNEKYRNLREIRELELLKPVQGSGR